MRIEQVDDSPIRQANHRLGNYNENQPAIFGIKMPFSAKGDQGPEKTNGLDVHFEVIDGDLPFLL